MLRNGILEFARQKCVRRKCHVSRKSFFTAYAIVSGWSTKGYMACPVCKKDVTSGWHAGKVCCLRHRRWLPWDHEWWEKDKEFDGNTERPPGTQSVCREHRASASNLENGPVMRSWNSLTV
ncbi:hypothetical protein L3X38_011870 [Prunus dulcis]|uniref:Uncharacterized protein n=1 Tax=Prunus dulcis TaxID=3755 RepID=A0AAD4WIY7_PRUDU|nr:hypothetical protein L3X38_011870 [Prunus dulcis]